MLPFLSRGIDQRVHAEKRVGRLGARVVVRAVELYHGARRRAPLRSWRARPRVASTVAVPGDVAGTSRPACSWSRAQGHKPLRPCWVAGADMIILILFLPAADVDSAGLSGA